MTWLASRRDCRWQQPALTAEDNPRKIRQYRPGDRAVWCRLEHRRRAGNVAATPVWAVVVHDAGVTRGNAVPSRLCDGGTVVAATYSAVAMARMWVSNC